MSHFHMVTWSHAQLGVSTCEPHQVVFFGLQYFMKRYLMGQAAGKLPKKDVVVFLKKKQRCRTMDQPTKDL